MAAAEADNETVVHRYTDDASTIALLRCLRAGAAAVDFVHHVDVCSAAPEDLVANLEPAPGTDIASWHFYCPKKFKNAQGKASGHRQRAIGGGGGDTCWHAEGRPKEVAGGVGGTVCNLSYGRKDGRSFSRLGWCMTEYDAQDQTDAAGYVLCKIYRSPRAQVKPSSSGKSASSGSKRKAAVSEHPEAPPAKLPHDQDAFFCHGPLPASVVAQVNNVEQWIGYHGPEQQSSQKDNEFLETMPCGDDVVFAVDEAEVTVEDLLGQEETTTASGIPPTALFVPLSDADLFDGLEFFGEEQSMQMQQPRAEFVQTPRATATACQQQQSQWMMPTSILQGPRFQLPCLMC
ncbi:unnamed protein product [Urochloa humidicola]